jgi:hypothetical protein
VLIVSQLKTCSSDWDCTWHRNAAFYEFPGLIPIPPCPLLLPNIVFLW